MNIQIFGKSKCFDTKKAERYFKERRVKFQAIDLIKTGISPGELKSVKNAVGLDALIDEANPDAALLRYLAYEEDKLEKMLEKKVTLVPTLSIIKWFGEYEEKNGNQAAADRFYHNVEKHGEFVKAAWEAGVPIACGTDENGMHGTGRCPEEYVSLAKAGLPNYAILQGANSVAAKTLDLQDKTGSLEAGKSADILVLNKNPLEDISILRSKENIAYVVQGV